MGSVRRECLDHLLILGEQHLHHVLKEYVVYFNEARPHQGIEQRIPVRKDRAVAALGTRKDILAFPILGGLHHDYRLAA